MKKVVALIRQYWKEIMEPSNTYSGVMMPKEGNMRILIVSDTHGRHDILEKVIAENGPFDKMFHLGDVENGENEIRQMANCPVEMVRGNNDYFSNLPRELEFMLGKYRIVMSHGHNYRVSVGLSEITREAQVRGIDYMMFGHLHRPIIEKRGSVTLINPGSISYPRQEGRRPTYIIMTIDEKEQVYLELKEVS